MTTMFMKNALMSLRIRPSVSSIRSMSVISSQIFSTSSSFALQQPPLLLISSTKHIPVQNPLVFNTGLQIDDFLPIKELECPTNSLNGEPLQAIKRTYQPSVLRRKRKHGFRTRRVSISGRKVLKRRFNKGRWRMSL
ncbi:hypothetical protein KXD40_009024 [Peronospora effusa]|uniref:Large ribosomal subunit protein bL34m n=1 Tax=Peronospora effusa TaxID=542832 RepID=A0A425CC47_9STRA|nr:hypothetical protein DD237_004482 [Peronospora effusa]UIZ25204.1 hypothetical protein KXD40_009024 [Peronospora effusa]CAI5712964.1 unnamed protein product [Peronospora effusa]